MGNSKERLRPPFNLAAGAGLAGPPGPCGLPGSVPALLAARTAAPPGHSPSPDSDRSWDTPSLPPTHDHQMSILPSPRSPHSRLSDFLSLHSTASTPPASRSTPAPNLGGPSHRTGLPPAQRPPAAPRAYSPCSLRPRSRTRERAPSDTELLTLARPHRPPGHRHHRRITHNNTPTYTATHTHLTQQCNPCSTKTHTQHTYNQRARRHTPNTYTRSRQIHIQTTPLKQMQGDTYAYNQQTPNHTKSTYAAHSEHTKLTRASQHTPKTHNEHAHPDKHTAPAYRGKRTLLRPHASTFRLKFCHPESSDTERHA